MKYVILGGVVLLLIVLIHQTIQFNKRIDVGRELAQNAHSFFHPVANPETRILIVGDSTALGTGVSSPEHSIAGRFHGEFPQAAIVNTGRNGAKLKEIEHQLTQVDGTYDFILIQGGANDILYFSSRAQAQKDLTNVLLAAKRKSGQVVLITSGNIGAAPIFPQPIGWYLTYRSQVFLNAFRTVANEHNVPMVDLFTTKKEDPFISDPKKWYAEDLLHLNNDGYGLWYKKIRETMDLNNIFIKHIDETTRS